MITETGYGKVNLALEITARRADGYHTIDTIFQSVGLYDRVFLAPDDHFSLSSSQDALLCDHTNLAYKAYAAMCAYTGRQDGVRIHLEKHIPVAAGLAGGSTDCAAVLRGLNRLWELGLSQAELAHIGAGLGADVPFCVYGGTMRGRGIGDELTMLPALPPWPVIILHPAVTVYTKEAYALFDSAENIAQAAVSEMEAAVQAQDREAVIRAMGNTFAQLVMPSVPEIRMCYELLQAQGLVPLLSGSGPTTFALVPEHINIDVVYESLCQAAPHMDVYKTTCTGGDCDRHENN